MCEFCFKIWHRRYENLVGPKTVSNATRVMMSTLHLPVLSPQITNQWCSTAEDFHLLRVGRVLIDYVLRTFLSINEIATVTDSVCKVIMEMDAIFMEFFIHTCSSCRA